MKTLNSIKQKLINQKIPFEEVTFIDEAVSARKIDSSVDKNYNPGNAIKTLIISTKKGYKALILKGNDKVDEEKLNKTVGKWSIISPNTLKEKLGFLPGCVCPLDLDLPFFIDKKAESLNVWSIGAGNINKGLNIETKIVLQHITNKQIVDISNVTNTY